MFRARRSHGLGFLTASGHTGIRSQRVIEGLVYSLDAALEPLEIEAQIVRNRKLAAFAGFDVGNRRQPVFELIVEPVLGLAGLEVQETQDQRAGKSEERG